MTDEEIQAELTRVLGVLAKIRDTIECNGERYPDVTWYQAIINEIRRFVAEVIPGDCDG